jgi:hypothetical protein
MDRYEFHELSTRALRTGFTGEITTQTATASAQKMVAVQGSKFIKVAVSKAAFLGMLPPANLVELANPKWQIPRVDRTRPQTSAGLGETAIVADAEYFDVSFDERTTEPQPFELGLKFSRRFTLDNVERGLIESTLEAECIEQFREDIEEAAINGDTTGSNGTYPTGMLTTIDGWAKRLRTEGVVYYADGAYMGETLFQNIIKSLPTERRKRGVADLIADGYKFFTSSDAVEGYVERLQYRPDANGSLRVTEDGRLTYRGIDVIGIPYFSSVLDGVAGHAVSNVSASFCEVWLAQPERFYVHYYPTMFIHRGLQQESGKIVYYYLYAALDVNVDIPEAVVIARDVRPTADTTITWA